MAVSLRRSPSSKNCVPTLTALSSRANMMKATGRVTILRKRKKKTSIIYHSAAISIGHADLDKLLLSLPNLKLKPLKACIR